MGLNYLITGGCGFIGSNLIRRILEDSPRSNIRVLDNLSSGTEDDLKKICKFENISCIKKPPVNIELYIGDIRDEKICNAAIIGIDVVVHLAASTGVAPSVQDPMFDFTNNVIGTLNLLNSARKVKLKKFIFASSGAPLGETSPPIHEELPTRPLSPYGASKLSGEGYASAYFHSYGIETVCLRFSNVYGPGSNKKESVIAKFIKNILSQNKINIYGDGNQTRDFIYIDDLIDAIAKAIQIDGVGGEVFQIATNRETSINDLILIITKSFKNRLNSKIIIENKEKRLGDVQRNYSSINKAKKILRWTPKTKITEGIIKTVSYFEEYK